MSHIVNFCPLTQFDGGLLCLREADEAAVNWLTAHANNNTVIRLDNIETTFIT